MPNIVFLSTSMPTIESCKTYPRPKQLYDIEQKECIYQDGKYCYGYYEKDKKKKNIFITTSEVETGDIISNFSMIEDEYRYFREIIEDKFKGYDVYKYHLIPIRLTSNITKTQIRKFWPILQRRINEIITEDTIFVTLGKEAFNILGFDASSVADIRCIPHRTTSGHIVYPIDSLKNLMTYSNGYKGCDFLNRCFDRIKEIKKDFNPYTIDYYSKFITIHDLDIIKAREALQELKKYPLLSFDIETAGWGVPKEAQLDYYHIDAEITLIALGSKDHVHVFNIHYLPDLKKDIKEVLEETEWLISWNGKFDIGFLKYLWGVKFGHQKHIDGAVCFYNYDMNAQFIGRGIGTLKTVTANVIPDGVRYAGYQKNDRIDEAIKEGDGSYLAEHYKEFMLYCGIDVYVTYLSVQYIYKQLSPQIQKRIYTYYEHLAETLTKIHEYGIRIDVQLLEEHITGLEKFCKQIEEYIQTTYPGLNLNSTKQLADILYNKRKLPERRTEKGSLSVTTDILEEFAYKDMFCKTIMDYKKFVKMLQNFNTIKKHIHNGRFYCTYNYLRTTSGRLTSVFHTIPKDSTYITYLGQTQDIKLERPIWHTHAIKRDEDNTGWQLEEYLPSFKSMFIADEGQVLLYADYNQLEIYILAYLIRKYSSDTKLLDALKSGKDIHSYTASVVFSILDKKEYTYEFMYQNAKKNPIEPYCSYRKKAKSIIFKLIYGGTYKSLALEEGVSEIEAKRIWDIFLTAFKGIKDYMNHQDEFAEENHYIETVFGQRRNLPILQFGFNNKAKNISYNHTVQGSGSLIVNEAVIELDDKLKTVYGRLLGTIHDSILCQVPIENYKEGAKIMEYCMIQYISNKYPDFIPSECPLSTDIEAGYSWGHVVKIDKFKVA